LGIAALLTITPGAGLAIVTRATLARGRMAARWATLGICTGLLAWAFVSVIGLAALLTASVTAFAVVKLAGVVFLIWLGLRLNR
jgi:threonine/homoserine/homoserine lactone efflux protein